jgi:hypothetical protein
MAYRPSQAGKGQDQQQPRQQAIDEVLGQVGPDLGTQDGRSPERK